MSDAISDFFRELGRRGHEPLLANATGSARFDLVRDDQVDYWVVTVKRGDVTTRNAKRDCDCVVRVDRSLFEEIARGEANVMSAVLRGELTAEGDLELLMLLQRLFPGPPASRPTGPPLGREERSRGR
jgi:putative sterol carrier protein